MHDVCFATVSSHAFVCLTCEIERFGYQFDLLAVLRCQINIQQLLKGVIYESLFIDGLFLFVAFHTG